MNLIRLGATQRRVKAFDHPAFDGVVSYAPAELAELTEDRLCGAPADELTLALRSTARYIIGRYLWHYRAARPFVDEMVGEALLAITMLVNGLQRDMLIDSNIQKLASRRVRERVEEALNALQGVSAPCVRTQRRNLVENLPLECLEAEREPEPEDKVCQINEETKYDLLDLVAALRETCEYERDILNPENWGLTDDELADKLGTSRRTINRCRNKLLTVYRTLTGETE